MNPNRSCPLFYQGDDYAQTQSVSHLLYNLMLMIRREIEMRMTEHGLTDAQWKPLWLLQSGRATTANELARVADCDAGAMTRLLDRLAAKGLIERSRSETDRRVVQLRLTSAGADAAAKIPPLLAALNNDFLRGFSEDEWLQLRHLLERMTANGQALRSPDAVAA